MQEDPAVTVIIPAYNQGHYLPIALESVVAQSYTSFEIVVVDDGSTDDTAAIAGQYGALVRYIYQENRGLAGARNTGIRAARAPLVAFLDSDDAWEPDYLRRMTSLADAHPDADVFYCGVHYVDADGKDTPQEGDNQVTPSDEMYQRLLRGNFLVPSTILARKEALCAAGLFDPAFRRLQDWELWLRMLAAGRRFVGNPKRLVRYRLHQSSLSTDPVRGQEAAYAIAEKQFGPDDGRYEEWPADKRRMYGGVYGYFVLTTLRHGGYERGEGARWLRKALQADPSLARDLDLFYEVALGRQPLGERGARFAGDLQRREAELRALLEESLGHERRLRAVRREAFGTAYFALGLVSYNAGRKRAALRPLMRSIVFRPRLLLQGLLLRVTARAMMAYGTSLLGGSRAVLF